jgi:hypothetical protein
MPEEKNEEKNEEPAKEMNVLHDKTGSVHDAVNQTGLSAKEATRRLSLGVPGPSIIHTLRKGETLQIKKSHGGRIIGSEFDRNAVVCFSPDEVVEWVNRWLVVTIDRMTG